MYRILLLAAGISACSVPGPRFRGALDLYAEWRAAVAPAPAPGPSSGDPCRVDDPPPRVAIELALPVPAGERVYCAKGILRAPGDSHSACNPATRFAYDLASSAYEPPRLVLASADGVAYGFGGCPSTDLQAGVRDECNLGFGNLVRVQHGDGLYTHVAHLSAILVRWGQKVQRGDPIGIEGNSGNAGGKHLHFSLHRGDARLPVTGPTVPLRALRTRAAVVDGLSLRCGDWTKSAEALPETALVSENEPRLPPPVLQKDAPGRFDAFRALALDEKDAGLRSAAREAIDRMAGAVDLYWFAAALQDRGELADADARFGRLADAKGPPWVRAWSFVRRGWIALRRQDARAARSAFEQALREPGADAKCREAARAGVARAAAAISLRPAAKMQ